MRGGHVVVEAKTASLPVTLGVALQRLQPHEVLPLARPPATVFLAHLAALPLASLPFLTSSRSACSRGDRDIF